MDSGSSGATLAPSQSIVGARPQSRARFGARSYPGVREQMAAVGDGQLRSRNRVPGARLSLWTLAHREIGDPNALPVSNTPAVPGSAPCTMTRGLCAFAGA